MSPVQADDWVQRFQAGTLDVADLEALEKMPVEEILAKLRSSHPVPFLSRSLGQETECGLARKKVRRYDYHPKVQWSGPSAQPAKLFRDDLKDCLLVTGESGWLTTLAAMTSLRFRPSRRDPAQFELTCGAGLSLYRDPDGWKIKLLEVRTVSLTRKSLQERGWLLETRGEGDY